MLTTCCPSPFPSFSLCLCLSEGVVNNVGEDFIAMLVLGVFNVSVPDAHMRTFKHVEEGTVGRV